MTHAQHRLWPWMCLVFACLLSALVWMFVRDLNRRLFIHQQQLIRQQQHLQEEQEKLLIERGTLLDPHRIQKLAHQQLGMRLPGPGQKVLLNRAGKRLVVGAQSS